MHTILFPGIDLAFIENGFIYHTKYDTADRILTDSIQRAGTQTSTCASIIYCLWFNIFVESRFSGSQLCLFISERTVTTEVDWSCFISRSQILMHAVHLCSIYQSVTGRHSLMLISLYPWELRNAYMHSSHRHLLSPCPRLPCATALSGYFALLSPEIQSVSTASPRQLRPVLSPSAASPHPSPLLLWTVNHRERHELWESESEISDGGRKYF